MHALVGAPSLHELTMPRQRRDADADPAQEAQRDSRDDERVAKMPGLLGQIDIGGDDGARLAVDDDRNIGFGINARAQRRMALLDRDDRPVRLRRAPCGLVVDGAADAGDLRSVGNELDVAVEIGDREAEHVADLLGANEEIHALGGGLRAVGDVLDVGDVLAYVFCPALGRGRRVPVEQIVHRHLERDGDAGDTDQNHDRADHGKRLEAGQRAQQQHSNLRSCSHASHSHTLHGTELTTGPTEQSFLSSRQ